MLLTTLSGNTTVCFASSFGNERNASMICDRGSIVGKKDSIDGFGNDGRPSRASDQILFHPDDCFFYAFFAMTFASIPLVDKGIDVILGHETGHPTIWP